MKYFFAGTETRQYAETLKRMNVVAALQSYYHLGFKRQPNEYQFPLYLLDSGGFTIRERGCDEINVNDYAEFINRHDVKIAFNLDTASMEESLKNQAVLENDTQAKILPIYHYNDWCDGSDELKNWIDDGYDYVAIAGSRAPKTSRIRFYEYCFSIVRNRARIHGLAATAIDDMLRFPFYSVDSTTWLNAEKFGEWHEFRNGRIMKSKSLRVESKGPNPRVRDLNQLIADRGHFMRASITAYLEFEKYVTELWAQRGVTWADG